MEDLNTIYGIRIRPLRPDLDWMYSVYKHSSGFVNIAKSIERETNLDPRTDFVRTTNFYYESPHHKLLTKKETFDSDGATQITEHRYPNDYENITDPNHVITQMKSENLHIIGTPVETRRYKNAKLIDASINVSGKFNGEGTGFFVAPKSIYKSFRKDSNPSTQWSSDPTQPDNNTFSKEVELNFDENANLVKVIPRDGINLALLWEPNCPYPIAKVTNATNEEVFFNSFEIDGTLDPINGAKTGKRFWNSGVYNFSSNGNFNPSNTADLRISYWYWSSGKWNFSGIETFQNIINRGTRLDEVRVFPWDSQMTTYTYDPFHGITSSTDVNNVTTYYRYDAMGRLELVKDADENIIEQYEYHYRTNN